MGAPTGIDVEAIRLENDKLKKEKAELEGQLKALSAKVLSLLLVYFSN
jgi:hypothetical protein